MLATQSLDYPGFPFGSLVPYSIGPDGWPLLLLSHLAKHTRNLEADLRCSLTLVEKGVGDSQQLMRLSCLGRITPLEHPEAFIMQKHFRYFPGSRKYFEELNFRFYGFQPEHFYCVGGFGTARWIGQAHLEKPNSLSSEEELQLIQELETEHQPSAVKLLKNLAGLLPEPGITVHIAGIDSLGMDIRQGEHIFRPGFSAEITSLSAARQAAFDTLQITKWITLINLW